MKIIGMRQRIILVGLLVQDLLIIKIKDVVPLSGIKEIILVRVRTKFHMLLQLLTQKLVILREEQY